MCSHENTAQMAGALGSRPTSDTNLLCNFCQVFLYPFLSIKKGRQLLYLRTVCGGKKELFVGKWHKLKVIYEKGIIKINNNQGRGKINNNQNLFLLFYLPGTRRKRMLLKDNAGTLHKGKISCLTSFFIYFELMAGSKNFKHEKPLDTKCKLPTKT